MKNLNIGVVGATGLVGETFLQLLNERRFPLGGLKLFASESSAGRKISVLDRTFTVETLKKGCFAGLDLVFFSSGNDISKEWAPQAVASGAFAVDNSSAFRMNPEVLLIVPEVNGGLLPEKNRPQIIANPNCSTIQLVVALSPLAKAFGLNDVKIATYQSASGAGREAMDELQAQFRQIAGGEEPSHQVFPAPLARNVIPKIGDFDPDGFSTEEKKLILETKKILGLPKLAVSAFAVRVPTMVGHAEAVWIRLDQSVSKRDIEATLEKSPGLVLRKDGYTLVTEAEGKNPVFVSRIHQDLSDEKTWLLWIVADNVRKGAAHNGLQIAEAIFDISPRT